MTIDRSRVLIIIAAVCSLTCSHLRAQINSTNNELLKKVLEQYPDADADGDGILTPEEAKQFRNALRGVSETPDADPNRPKPAFANVKYGPHKLNVLDIYLPKSQSPAPLVIYIHGGGFLRGDKKDVNPGIVNKCLDAGVALAAINYRYFEHAPLPEIMRDSARALQFLRHNSAKYNIDKKRFAAFGVSAGAGTALWLAAHDDLADPKSKDPVLHESSRLAAVGVVNGQFTYDFEKWAPVIGNLPGGNEKIAANAFALYGLKSAKEISSRKGKQIRADLDMQALLTKDDPPVFLYASGKTTDAADYNHYLHHPRHTIAVYGKCRLLAIDSTMLLKAEDPKLTGVKVSEKMLAFFFKYLKVAK